MPIGSDVRESVCAFPVTEDVEVSAKGRIVPLCVKPYFKSEKRFSFVKCGFSCASKTIPSALNKFFRAESSVTSEPVHSTRVRFIFSVSAKRSFVPSKKLPM